jgi:site-specific recombinase XerD
MKIQQARERYLRWLRRARDLSPHTVRAYAGDVIAFEQHLGSANPIESIDQNSVLHFIDAQRSAGLMPASVRRRASGIRGFCRWMASTALLPADPWPTTNIRIRRPKRLPRIVPTHELDALLNFLSRSAHMGDPDIPLATLRRPHESTTLLAVSLMVASGMRVNEVVGIKCRDIDLPGRRVRLVGKGNRERQVYLTNDWIATLTDAYLQTRVAKEVTHEQLFFNVRWEPLTAPAMRDRLVKAAADAGLRTRVTPHMLRHTAATQLIEAGVDIRYIQRLLGHASLTTTEIYTHVSDRSLMQVLSGADVLGRSLGTR